MDYDELIMKTEEFSEKYCYKDFQRPWLWNHTDSVRSFAIKLAKIEDVDVFPIEMAALLHDLGKLKEKESHQKWGVVIAKEFFRHVDPDNEIPKEKKELIYECIEKHSSGSINEDNKIEVKIIQSADCLSLIFSDRFLNKCKAETDKEKLLKRFHKVKKKLCLNSAKEIGRHKVEELGRMID